ncbi:hypothetical protein [Pseudomonas ogarae]|uniref:hypothetical protein n=1 Tax=Pseudomonas ogarae (strain DSM 112162 / CECT 30235 / F113) TaxID=1114970 RepID=UPI001950BFE8|nr:hypothetical protein [Pseudomonas ogarae]
MRYSSNGVTSMCCETHKSFQRRIFKPNESNFRAQIKLVADGHRDTALMKIQRKTFIALTFDRSHAPAWERYQGRSAFRFCKVTQSVTGCIPTQSVVTINTIDQRLAAPHSIPYHPHLFFAPLPGSRLFTGAQSGKS